MGEPLTAVPPHDQRMEEDVVAAVMVDDLVMERVRPILPSGDLFYSSAAATVYQAECALHDRGEPITPTSVWHELTTQHMDETVGGYAYLSDLTTNLPTTVGVEHAARTVAGLAFRRQTWQAAMRMVHLVWDETIQVDDLAVRATALLAETVRKGLPSPTLNLVAGDDLEQMEVLPVEYAVQGLLPEGLTILAGKPKSGKSFLAANLALAVQLGGKALGALDTDQGDVLYLGLEDGFRRLRRRFKQLLPPGQPIPSGISVAEKWDPMDEGGLAKMQAWLADHPRARLIVVDTLQKVRPAERKNENPYGRDYRAIEPLHDLAQQYRVAILVVHHTRKGDAEDAMDLISGTFGLSGAADCLLVLRRKRGTEDGLLNLYGRDMDEQDYGLKWDAQIGTWQFRGDARELDRSESRDEIVALLVQLGRALTPKEVADMLPDREYSAVKKLMWFMSKDGDLQVVPGSRGSYRLPDGVAPLSRSHNSSNLVTSGSAISTVSEVTEVSTGGEVVSDMREMGGREGYIVTELPSVLEGHACAHCGAALREGACYVCNDRQCQVCGGATGSTLKPVCDSCAAKAQH